jgi:hypothetical protein
MSLKAHKWPMRFCLAIAVIIYGKYTYTGLLEGWSLMGFIEAYVNLTVIVAGAMAACLAFCHVVLCIHHVVTTWKKSPNK